MCTTAVDRQAAGKRAHEDGSRRRLVIVSYFANAPFSPRGIRTRALVEALRHEWEVELVAGPVMGGTKGEPLVRDGTPYARKGLRLVHSAVLLDKFEFWSRHRFRSWGSAADAAVLVGYPFSPLVFAARHLVDQGVPYVVDAGDPWLLTGALPELHGPARLRGRRAERTLWAHAAGAVLTTEQQAAALRRIFPHLRILVRPNGFAPVSPSKADAVDAISPHDRSALRLVHFGEISSDRVAVDEFLRNLARSGFWKKLEFHQFGSDWTGKLRESDDVRVVFHAPQPWEEVVAGAGQYDAAVVVGNRDPMLLPSKAVAYLQLPIPRLALVDGSRTDALTAYVADKPGWKVVTTNGPGVAEVVRRHTSRKWSAQELAPVASESWEHVSGELARFLTAVLRTRRP